MSKNPSVLLLEHHLKVLKLPTFLRDYDSVGAVCGQERCDYPTFLLRLAERELIDRERRATERRIKEAAFPVVKTIDTFDFAAQPRSTNRWCGNSCGANTSANAKTCCWSAIPAPAKPTWPPLWALPPARRANGCGSPPPRDW